MRDTYYDFKNVESTEKMSFRVEDTAEKDLPLVSIIMPVYNSEKTLVETLRSLLLQKYKKLEIICINDGSTDGSLKILEQIAKSDRRIRIINQENGGPAKARNAGLDAAKGKYISFVDADDLTDEWMYYSLVEYAEDECADIIVFGGAPFPDADNAPGWIWEKMSPQFKIYDYEGAGQEALFKEKSSVPFLWLHFIRREIIERNPKLRFNVDMDLGEDQLFQFMYFPRANKIIYWDKRYYFYRWQNNGSLMWKYNHKRVTKFQKHLQIVENVIKSWKDAQYEDVYGDLVTWLVNFLYYDLMSFPAYKQYELATEIMDIIKKYQINTLVSKEVEKIRKVEQIASEPISFEEDVQKEILSRKVLIDQMENEIRERLKSRAFKLGVKLTPKKERIDISDVLPPLEKKN